MVYMFDGFICRLLLYFHFNMLKTDYSEQTSNPGKLKLIKTFELRYAFNIEPLEQSIFNSDDDLDYICVHELY